MLIIIIIIDYVDYWNFKLKVKDELLSAQGKEEDHHKLKGKHSIKESIDHNISHSSSDIVNTLLVFITVTIRNREEREAQLSKGNG